VPLLTYAGGMFVITIISSINTQLDKLVVSKLFSVQDFGYYTLAGTLAQIPVSATSPIAIALFPVLTAMIAKREILQSRLIYERYTFIVALLASFGAIGLALFTGDVFTLWLAGKTIPAHALEAAVYLSLGSLFLCLQLTPYYLSLANNDNWIIATLAGGTLLLSTPLVYIGASRFGLRGAAIPWLVLNMVNFGVLSFAINRRHYQASHLLWLAKFVALPVGIAGSSMALALGVGLFWSANALISCLIALFAASVTIVLVWRFADYFLFAQVSEGSL
jgi:O-antigen/teichoic acid export membrane protein